MRNPFSYNDGAVDFVFEVAAEKKPDNGEDSYAFFLSQSGGMVAVFDGCGGSGARRYAKFQGKTGAYIASRAAAGAAKSWAKEETERGGFPENEAALKAHICRALDICQNRLGETVKFKGKVSRDFPTTMAMMTFEADRSSVKTKCCWVGDSRCYMLCASGLYQLSEDDLGGIDAMENLTRDGVLRNVISATGDFDINVNSLEVTEPCVLFTATDGCFGYLHTPMEFEFLLESTLLRSASATQWEDGITGELADTAGDDFTLSGVCLNYGSFETLKNALRPRAEYIYERYITNSRTDPLTQWNEYKTEYYKYCKR